jgi:hypothetical protein
MAAMGAMLVKGGVEDCVEITT